MSSRTAASTPAAIGARRRLKLLMFVMIIFMSWAAYTLVDQYTHLNTAYSQMRESGKKLTDAEAKSDALKQEISRLNDPEYIGQIARRDQGMGMPGEQPIQFEKSAP
ncbi:septum formation initiator family protein [Cohnella pontilimi]|uniref:Septum formation initiator family protein n=1 Tax=Cohnella pontilimi TaxID=2564100 RepID=A0A4U0F264_9BACL|nr:septum formation initiator family protein [Cohnella pontilimi]TJY38557.1 septum formation initiator family protein [Cohnella pontilimi]